ncbi:putative ROK family protein [Vibrio nigripulchritudo MADA3029]|uniref:ROK family protein n=1 Tax=Vibrio nigripulchritudo TaxID=28173 RepID=UPI0003B22B99|nr:ROK family protein [Vibrio nigripulchritudo]CCN48669.1 putative ROK family protein [Vibrio nigripulchritudo MADA3020]CCN52733.1 putative ROK family protein [Vibrio nigripulchritudo MADA3021]CCN57776.1 putative ROK family protein [Vibrio nigripulchritudo MADA3029]
MTEKKNETKKGSSAKLKASGIRSVSTILNLIRTQKADTRQAIERESELGRAIVADRLAALADMNLVHENQRGIASGGRAPRLVQFNQNAGYILVARLDSSALGVGLSDLSGNLLVEHHEECDLNESPEETTSRLIALFEWVIEKKKAENAIWGIGLAVPGPVNTLQGNEFWSRTPDFLPSWSGFPLVETLIAHFEAPVWLRSSVEAMAVGEYYAGAEAATQDMMFIKIGQRINASMMLNGELYRGAHGVTGLIGQLPVTREQGVASLESLAGNDAIVNMGADAAKNGESSVLKDVYVRQGQLSAIDVGQAAQMGDPSSMNILLNAGRLVGQIVAPIVTMLNPSLVVLGGSLAQTNDTLLAAFREGIYGASHPLVTRDLQIVRSQLDSSASLVGAAMVVVDALFAPSLLQNWIFYGSPIASEAFLGVASEARNHSVIPDEEHLVHPPS